MITYTGHNHTAGCPKCKDFIPHYPKDLGSYNTNNYGKLTNFCKGVKGDGVDFDIIKSVKGDAHSPSLLKWRKND